METIERMTLAAEKYPALPLRALLSRVGPSDSGDNQSAAATFRG